MKKTGGENKPSFVMIYGGQKSLLASVALKLEYQEKQSNSQIFIPAIGLIVLMILVFVSILCFVLLKRRKKR